MSELIRTVYARLKVARTGMLKYVQ
jgi:hypothetical protein